MIPREEYNQLLHSGMFWEFHPELTGEWRKDFKQWFEIKGLYEGLNMIEKLKLYINNSTQEEIQADWDEVVESTKGIDWMKGYSTDNIVVDSQFDTQTIYEALYCCDIHDSSYATLSLHKTRKGAEETIENHKQKIKAEFDDIYHNPEYPVDMVVEMKYDDNQVWTIRETELLD